MKRFLLSILCCLLAVIPGLAEEVTKNVTFSNYTAGTQYAKNEMHDLGDGLVIYTTLCHFTTELRIYSSGTNNGYVVSDALPGNITRMTFNAGNKVDVLVVYGSNDGNTWTEVGEVSVTSTSYKDYSLDFSGSYTHFKLDVKGSNQIRLKKMSVTYEKSGAIEPPKETVADPVISPASKEFKKDETVSVSISTETEGATIYYTTNGTTPSASNGTKYEDSFEVNSTTTVKAIAVKEGCNDSGVASATYTMVDPNAKTGTISFASTAQRISQDGNAQVWRNDGITFTNNKASSQNAVVSNVNPVRLYAGSSITIECSAGNITKIEFDCNTTAYATALNNSITNGATASSDKVTVTLDGTSSSFTVQKLSAQVRLDALTVTYVYNGTTITPTLESPTIIPGSCLFDDQIEVSITAEEGATILYCLNGEEPNVEYTEPIVITEDTTIKAKATKDGCNDSEVSEVTFTKVVVEDGQIVDKLTRELTGAEGNTYSEWSGKTVTSSAVYAGQSAGSYDAIQLRVGSSDNGYSGIVTTNSGGKVKKIIVEWNENTRDGRTLDVYAKNSAYSSSEDLYDSKTGDIKLGSIVKGTSSTEFEINGDYEYIGLRSADGAMYLNSIRIVWEVESTEDDEPTSETWGSLYSPYDVEIPENVKVYIVTGENNGYVRLANITGAVPAMTGVIYNGEWNNKETAKSAVADVTGNLLTGSVVDEDVEEEAFVLAKVDGVVGFYKALMNQKEGTAFKNNGGKAYLPVSALTQSAQNAASLKFRFDNQTTGIEGAPALNTAKAIYDLSGRKVNDITAPGLYIVNGKKVMVK